MSEKRNVPLSLTMGHLIWYCDLSNYAILSFFLYHHVGDKFSVPLIYYTRSLHFSYYRYLSNSKIYTTTKFNERTSFDSFVMLEDAIKIRLINQ